MSGTIGMTKSQATIVATLWISWFSVMVYLSVTGAEWTYNLAMQPYRNYQNCVEHYWDDGIPPLLLRVERMADYLAESNCKYV